MVDDQIRKDFKHMEWKSQIALSSFILKLDKTLGNLVARTVVSVLESTTLKSSPEG